MSFLFQWGSSFQNTSSQSPAAEAHSSNSTSNEIQPQQQSSQQPPPSDYPRTQNQQTHQRLPNNLKILLAGTALGLCSAFITRRSLLRRQLATIPPFYTSSTYHRPQVSGALEALEALNLATINVISFGMISVGVGMCALDVNNIDDMRRRMRSRASSGETGRVDRELEKEVEEWFAKALNLKIGEENKAQDEKENEKEQNEKEGER